MTIKGCVSRRDGKVLTTFVYSNGKVLRKIMTYAEYRAEYSKQLAEDEAARRATLVQP